MNSKIGAILLTAGESSRMGQPKALLPWGNGRVLEHVERIIMEAGIQDVVLVTGAHHKEISTAFPQHRSRICFNSDWASGMGGSICVGTLFLMEKYPELTGILIALIDQPLIHSEYLKKLIIKFESGSCNVVASEYKGTKGAPAIFGRSYFKNLLQLPKNQGAKSIINDAGSDVFLVSAGDLANDMDTPEAYMKLKGIQEAGN